MVLVDDGCSVDGYQSDITRTTVISASRLRASARSGVWSASAQDAALAAAKPGATCESVDAAARKVITDFGFGPDYKVPGLPHRTGHGIGLDIHEWTYLVRGNKTRLQPGMCFSDEPMVAIYGEFGVRLEDCMYITEDRRQDLQQAESGHRSALRVNPMPQTEISESTYRARIAKVQDSHEGVRPASASCSNPVRRCCI